MLISDTRAVVLQYTLRQAAVESALVVEIC